jgi:hypothetical protein
LTPTGQGPAADVSSGTDKSFVLPQPATSVAVPPEELEPLLLVEFPLELLVLLEPDPDPPLEVELPFTPELEPPPSSPPKLPEVPLALPPELPA